MNIMIDAPESLLARSGEAHQETLQHSRLWWWHQVSSYLDNQASIRKLIKKIDLSNWTCGKWPKNAGCGLVVGVLSGADSAADLLAAGADIIADCVTDLPVPLPKREESSFRSPDMS